MSLTFTEITALIDDTAKTSATSYSVADKTRDINLALDRVLSIIFEVDGTWQFDDNNHTDYPVITTNLVANQRDYTFLTDEQGNLILEIHRVAILPSATATLYQEIDPFDELEDRDNSIVTGNTATGTPSRYGKLANGIFLDTLPGYNATNGLKVFINREASYFTTSDTTKKPGFAGLFHEYLALRPAYQYAYRNSLKNLPLIRDEMLRMERDIRDYYGRREKDIRHVLTGKRTNFI